MGMKTYARMAGLGVLTVLVMVCATMTTHAQAEEASRRRNFNIENGVAMRGFDPVSYFSSKPLKGDPKFYHNHKGITYYFASAENRDRFAEAPEKYEPVFGGWCAYTVANTGDRVKINPATYKIVDGKLHLFYNFNGDNRLRRWNAEEQKLRSSGNRNWNARMH